MDRRARNILLLLPLLALAACPQPPRRFPLAAPKWEDADRNHVPVEPAEYYSGMIADVGDKTLFRPLSHLFKFPLPGEAANINALDEVPNSSWFHNRIGQHATTPAVAARGACTEPPLDPAKGPWMVAGAKPDGANPGFFVKTPQGTYLFKFDGPVQPERATAADVIGSRIYHAAGYHAPCNQVVWFKRDVLKIAPGAKAKNKYGEKFPVTSKEVDQVLSKAFRLKDGTMRASASAFLPGKPLGPWTYNDTRSDDPNDVIRHEDRRELRGARVLASWINHWDSREQNTLDVWVNSGERNFIRHYYIDFGDTLGSRWEQDGISRRLGNSYYLALDHVLVDLLTLGLLDRPWFNAKLSTEAEIFGYFNAENFEPARWRSAYPNPAFDRMTFRDALWMVRILARFSDAHVRALVKEGKFTFARDEAYAINTLIKRRNKILREYLTKYPPLDRFRLVRRGRTSDRRAQSLCFEDLALLHKLVPSKDVLYKLRFMGGEGLDKELGWLQFQPDPDHPHRSCVLLPIGDKRPANLAGVKAKDDDPRRYGVMHLYVHQRPTLPPTSNMEVHFYDLGPERGFRLVGVQRNPELLTPDLPAEY